MPYNFVAGTSLGFDLLGSGWLLTERQTNNPFLKVYIMMALFPPSHIGTLSFSNFSTTSETIKLIWPFKY